LTDVLSAKAEPVCRDLAGDFALEVFQFPKIKVSSRKMRIGPRFPVPVVVRVDAILLMRSVPQVPKAVVRGNAIQMPNLKPFRARPEERCRDD